MKKRKKRKQNGGKSWSKKIHEKLKKYQINFKEKLIRNGKMAKIEKKNAGKMREKNRQK